MNHINWISRVVLDLREQWVVSGRAESFEEINSGQCEDFAEALVEAVLEQSAEGDTPEIETIELPNFFRIDPKTGFALDEGGPLDRAKLSAALPNMKPPQGMSWDDLDRFIWDASICWGYHVFAICEGRVFDSEAPHGVDGIFDLPFYQRFIARFENDMALQPGL
jgi:hypothetical protein